MDPEITIIAKIWAYIIASLLNLACFEQLIELTILYFRQHRLVTAFETQFYGFIEFFSYVKLFKVLFDVWHGYFQDCVRAIDEKGVLYCQIVRNLVVQIEVLT